MSTTAKQLLLKGVLMYSAVADVIVSRFEQINVGSSILINKLLENLIIS